MGYFLLRHGRPEDVASLGRCCRSGACRLRSPLVRACPCDKLAQELDDQSFVPRQFVRAGICFGGAGVNAFPCGWLGQVCADSNAKLCCGVSHHVVLRDDRRATIKIEDSRCLGSCSLVCQASSAATRGRWRNALNTQVVNRTKAPEITLVVWIVTL